MDLIPYADMLAQRQHNWAHWPVDDFLCYMRATWQRNAAPRMLVYEASTGQWSAAITGLG